MSEIESKRYLVFAGDYYYPLGGWGDFYDAFDTVEQAVECINGPAVNEWAEVVDGLTQKRIMYFKQDENWKMVSKSKYV